MGWVICALVLACTACGSKTKAGKTPKETVRKFESAIRDADLGACYDLMSSRTRKQLDRAMLGIKGMLAALPDSALDQVGLDGIADMDAREILVACSDAARKQAPALFDKLKGFQIVVLNVDQYGNKAQVEVSQLMDGQEQTTTLPLVQEEGRWYLDSNETIDSLPVNIQPNLQACVAPS